MNRFKNNGENFRVLFFGKNDDVAVVSSGKTLSSEISDVSVPEELVQIQAYLRWERNGKQMYTPEQEKASVLICHLI
jgi:alpha-glucan, water dikinase